MNRNGIGGSGGGGGGPTGATTTGATGFGGVRAAVVPSGTGGGVAAPIRNGLRRAAVGSLSGGGLAQRLEPHVDRPRRRLAASGRRGRRGRDRPAGATGVASAGISTK